jgi:hypothetical protein
MLFVDLRSIFSIKVDTLVRIGYIKIDAFSSYQAL